MGEPILDYESFCAEDYLKQKGAIIGAGRCGGKAKGLAYTECILAGSPLGEAIGFPDLSIVLSTELFDEYMARNGLGSIIDEEDWKHARDVVYDLSFPPPIKIEQ